MDWFFNWLGERIRKSNNGGVMLRMSTAVESPSANGGTHVDATRRLELIKAVNGDLLEVWTRPSRAHDWVAEVYIVRPDEALADAIATMLVVTGGK